MKKSFFGKMGLCVFAFAAVSFSAKAQVSASAGADIVSAYEWRGQDLGGASVQPSASISGGGFSLAAWGNVALDKSGNYTSELDFTAGYAVGHFSALVTDYYSLPNEDFSQEKYFQYCTGKTKHVYEGTLAYDFGPLALAWNTNFAGADGVKSSGKRAYSSYFEAKVPFKLGGVDMKAEMGITPWETSYYVAGGFSVINLGLTASKTIKIADLSIPAYVKIGANPRTERSYVVFGITL